MDKDKKPPITPDISWQTIENSKAKSLYELSQQILADRQNSGNPTTADLPPVLSQSVEEIDYPPEDYYLQPPKPRHRRRNRVGAIIAGASIVTGSITGFSDSTSHDGRDSNTATTSTALAPHHGTKPPLKPKKLPALKLPSPSASTNTAFWLSAYHEPRCLDEAYDSAKLMPIFEDNQPPNITTLLSNTEKVIARYEQAHANVKYSPLPDNYNLLVADLLLEESQIDYEVYEKALTDYSNTLGIPAFIDWEAPSLNPASNPNYVPTRDNVVPFDNNFKKQTEYKAMIIGVLNSLSNTPIKIAHHATLNALYVGDIISQDPTTITLGSVFTNNAETQQIMVIGKPSSAITSPDDKETISSETSETVSHELAHAFLIPTSGQPKPGMAECLELITSGFHIGKQNLTYDPTFLIKGLPDGYISLEEVQDDDNPNKNSEIVAESNYSLANVEEDTTGVAMLLTNPDQDLSILFDKDQGDSTLLQRKIVTFIRTMSTISQDYANELTSRLLIAKQKHQLRRALRSPDNPPTIQIADALRRLPYPYNIPPR